MTFTESGASDGGHSVLCRGCSRAHHTGLHNRHGSYSSMGPRIRPWECYSERCNHIGCSRARVTMSEETLRFTSLGLETENNVSNQCDVKRN